MTDIIEKAREYATKAHEGQTRKDGLTPYIVHPEAVAALVEQHWPRHQYPTEDVVHDGQQTASYQYNRDRLANTMAAAWLHDVVEDTPVTLEEIEQEFGKDIAYIVDGVTKIDGLKPRTLRKLAFWWKTRHYAEGSSFNNGEFIHEFPNNGKPWIILLKLCDMLHNSSDTKALGDFARTQAAEILTGLEVMIPSPFNNFFHKTIWEVQKNCMAVLPEIFGVQE